MTNFIEEQQREVRKKLTSPEKVVRDALGKTTDAIVTETITNTLNHILVSGLLEEKEEHQDWCKLTGELEYSSCGCWKDHNTAVRNIKELLEKLSK